MRKALTLVELLIVIGIILVLTALLFPVFGSSRRKAKETTCAQNQKSIYRALYLYASDYPDAFYPELGPLVYIPYSATWFFETKYLRSQDVLFCPEWPARKKGIGGSYTIWEYGDPEEPDLTEDHDGVSASGLRKRIVRERELRGADMRVIDCMIHDQLHYQPKEGEKGDPWLIWTRDDGSIKTGRLPGALRISWAESYGRMTEGQK